MNHIHRTKDRRRYCPKSQVPDDGIIHAAFPYHPYKTPSFLTTWCQRPEYGYQPHAKNGTQMTKTVRPDFVTCVRCLTRMQLWTDRQQGAPMPMEIMAEELGVASDDFASVTD